MSFQVPLYKLDLYANFVTYDKMEKKEKNVDILENYFYDYCTHITSNYIKFLIWVNFYGILHLVDVELN